jgi:hypothetical protein
MARSIQKAPEAPPKEISTPRGAGVETGFWSNKSQHLSRFADFQQS